MAMQLEDNKSQAPIVADAGLRVRVAQEANKIKGVIKRLLQDFDPSKCQFLSNA